MLQGKNIKSNIVKRLNKFSKKKLEDVLRFLDKIEDTANKRESILSFAGCWAKMDKSTFEDFNKNLPKRRKELKTRNVR